MGMAQAAGAVLVAHLAAVALEPCTRSAVGRRACNSPMATRPPLKPIERQVHHPLAPRPSFRLDAVLLADAGGYRDVSACQDPPRCCTPCGT